MTPTSRFLAALGALHWGPVVLSELLDVNERTVRRWIAGQNDPPPAVLEWLEKLAAFVEANPPP